MTTQFKIKTSQYVDSVSLMNIVRQVQNLDGIDDASLMMGTDANKRLLEQIGVLPPEVQAAKPTDLIMMVIGAEDVLENAFSTAEALLAKPQSITNRADSYRARTLRSVLRSQSDANLAVVSVAGIYATAEAWNALYHGLHVLLFSDNVSLEDEIALKRYAVEHNLLLMGPGAGTAIINGAALGFANAVPRGPVGIVSAAGTGLQEVSSLLARQSVGVSQGIGVGGRDLSDDVGGLMMFHAIDALQADPATQVIVAISKLPSPTIADNVLSRLADGDKPSVVIFMGAENPSSPANHVYVANTLHEAAAIAAILARNEDPVATQQLTDVTHNIETQFINLAAKLTPTQKYLRGLFSGGTLCEEAMRLWNIAVGPVWSNGPLRPEWQLPDSTYSHQHCALDLGDEEFTVGRPHPMIDNDLRIRRLLQEARDPEVAVIQLDIVLGYGAHPDPASELAPAIRQAREIAAAGDRELIVIAALTGTDDDPQNYRRQQTALESAGVILMESNARASQLAALVVASNSQ